MTLRASLAALLPVIALAAPAAHPAQSFERGSSQTPEFLEGLAEQHYLDGNFEAASALYVENLAPGDAHPAIAPIGRLGAVLAACLAKRP